MGHSSIHISSRAKPEQEAGAQQQQQEHSSSRRSSSSPQGKKQSSELSLSGKQLPPVTVTGEPTKESSLPTHVHTPAGLRPGPGEVSRLRVQWKWMYLAREVEVREREARAGLRVPTRLR